MKKATARKLLIEELKKTPVISVACKKAGVSRQSFYRWTGSDREFLMDMVYAMRNGIRYFNDIAESQLLIMIQEKNFSAVRYWLDRRHPLYMAKYFKEKTDLFEDRAPQNVIIEVGEPYDGPNVHEQRY